MSSTLYKNKITKENKIYFYNL